MSSERNDDFLDSLIAFQESLASISAADLTLDSAVSQALSLVLELMDAQVGRLVLWDERSEPSRSWSVSSSESGPLSTATLLADSVQQLEKRVLEDGTAVLSAVALDPSTPDWRALCAPMRQGGQICGTLLLLSPVTGAFTNVQRDRLALCAASIAQMIALIEAQARGAAARRREDLLVEESNDLAAMLVHDLQGPLGNIIAGLEMAQSACAEGDAESARSMFETALHSSYQLRTLVASVLDISRLETGQPLPPRKAVSARQLAEFALSLMQPEFDMRGVAPILEIDAGLPAALANDGMLQRVFLNLLDNALKASRAGQSILVRADHDPARPYLTITVSDQGSGIPEAYHQRVFQKYERVNADNSSRGLGLGLAFCRLAVTAHGGDIWVENNPGGGSSFVFTLPLAPESPA